MSYEIVPAAQVPVQAQGQVDSAAKGVIAAGFGGAILIPLVLVGGLAWYLLKKKK